MLYELFMRIAEPLFWTELAYLPLQLFAGLAAACGEVWAMAWGGVGSILLLIGLA